MPLRRTEPDPDAVQVSQNQLSGQAPPLHDCPYCHTRFLTLVGLEKYPLTHDHLQAVDGPAVRLPRCLSLIQFRSCCNIHLKSFQCPLCQDHVGRKALDGHFRRKHYIVNETPIPEGTTASQESWASDSENTM